MVAMDFFAALNCYDFLNQYCSNLLKNPTVRGLIRMYCMQVTEFQGPSSQDHKIHKSISGL